jgi:hypothetical protein
MPRNGAVSHLSLAELERMLRGRQRELIKLQKRRSRIQKKLDRLDAQIATIGGSSGRHNGSGAGRRARNEVKLPDAIARVLENAGGPMRVPEIADKVRARGYESNSANFKGIVNQALIKDKRFASAGRGVYQMKSAKKEKAGQ